MRHDSESALLTDFYEVTMLQEYFSRGTDETAVFVVQAHDHETAAFAALAHAFPENTTLLIGTCDTEPAAQQVVRLAQWLREEEDIRIKAVRIDSGDLGQWRSACGAFWIRAIAMTSKFLQTATWTHAPCGHCGSRAPPSTVLGSVRA